MIDVSKLKVGDEIFGRGISNVRRGLRIQGFGLKQTTRKMFNTKTGKANKVYVVYKLRKR